MKCLHCIAPLISAVVLALVTTVSVSEAARDKEEPLDLAILEETDRLLRYLTTPQRLEFIRAEALAEEGASDIRSGEHMINRGPSKLNPGENLTKVREEGARVKARGEAKLRESQEQMVALLEMAESARAEAMEPKVLQYGSEIPVHFGFEAAFRHAAGNALTESWEAGYRRVFFNGVQDHTGNQSEKAEASYQNTAYDILTEIDGTRFSVSMPIDLELGPDPNLPSQPAFTYANAAAYGDDTIVLISVELFSPSSEIADQMLLVQVLDLDTLQLVSHQLAAIDSGGDETTSPEPIRINLVDQTQTIQQLDSPELSYQFQIVTAEEIEMDGMLLGEFLTHLICSETGVSLIPVSLLQRAFLTSQPSALNWPANAEFLIEPDADQVGGFRVSAEAETEAAERRLEIGPLQIGRASSELTQADP